MTARGLIEAWAALVALSMGTAALTMLDVSGSTRTVIAAGVLALAGLKSRVILARYLRLNQSRFWTRLFDVVLAIFLGIAFAAYLLGIQE
ncbi:MAG: hypothetical protein MUF06_24650 [Pirellulaceae bacterium]|jgi:uncharacterized membrane protein HdeD (DUF308 family)|nr:hypothetical protein [Pirellulaceae bacterium]